MTSIFFVFEIRGRFTVEPSYAKVENLVFGRMAFRGMNPEVERMMEAERAREEEEAAARRETAVDDEAMAAHFGNLRATVGRKFATKRQAAASAAAASGGGGGASSSSSSSQEQQDGEDILRRGAEMVGSMRSQNKTWRKEEFGPRQQQQQQREQQQFQSGGGKGGAGKIKVQKFMKPPQD